MSLGCGDCKKEDKMQLFNKSNQEREDPEDTVFSDSESTSARARDAMLPDS